MSNNNPNNINSEFERQDPSENVPLKKKESVKANRDKTGKSKRSAICKLQRRWKTTSTTGSELQVS